MLDCKSVFIFNINRLVLNNLSLNEFASLNLLYYVKLSTISASMIK